LLSATLIANLFDTILYPVCTTTACIYSSSCLHPYQTVDISINRQNTRNIINVTFVCNCLNAQNYRNWVHKLTRSLHLVSDGASNSGVVSTVQYSTVKCRTVHCYQNICL